MTGSTTSGISPADASRTSATVSTDLRRAKQASLDRRTGKFARHNSICSRTLRASIASIRETFPGTSATTQVTAVRPKTPSALNVFRSAWRPAPALQSEPAMVRATGCDSEPWWIRNRESLTSWIGPESRFTSLDSRTYAPSLPIASTGQPSIASLQRASSSGDSGCL